MIQRIVTVAVVAAIGLLLTGGITFSGGHGQPGQILQGRQHFPLCADEVLQLSRCTFYDGDDRPTGLHIDLDVSVEVEDVQQSLEVVSGDIALLIDEGRPLLGLDVDRQRIVAVLGQHARSDLELARGSLEAGAPVGPPCG